MALPRLSLVLPLLLLMGATVEGDRLAVAASPDTTAHQRHATTPSSSMPRSLPAPSTEDVPNGSQGATPGSSQSSDTSTETVPRRSQALTPRRSQAPSTRPSATSTYISLFRYVCPAEFLRLGNGCYYFSKDMADWSSAHFECRERNSQLVVVGSEWEDNTLRRYLNRPEMTRLNRWLGGLYDWSRMSWVWGSSGEVMQYQGFLSIDSRTPRSPRWKCAFTAPSLYYRWNYARCSDVMHYVCEAPFTRLQRQA